MRVIESLDADLGAVLAVSRAAFGDEDVPALVRELLADPSAHPLYNQCSLPAAQRVDAIQLAAG